MTDDLTPIPYVDIVGQHAQLRDDLLAATARVIDHGQFVGGPEVAEFEERFAEFCGVKHAVAVNSGTDALVLAMRVLDIGPGDEVITAPNSFIATASSIVLAGATPVFVDVGDDYNIDPHRIEKAITPRTRAIMPVHLTGRSADMTAITDIARQHDLSIIEDAAQAVGALHRGRPVGGWGDLGAFSLHPLKTLNACGDAGVVTTNRSERVDRLRRLRNHGLEGRDRCLEWGFNSRLDTLQAAQLLVKLEHLEVWTSARRRNARLYRELLADIAEVVIPDDRTDDRAVYHTLVVQVENRDGLKQYLTDRKIGTAIHYPICIHLQPAARDLGYEPGSFPNAERQAEKILSLPIYPELSTDQITRVAHAICEFYSR